VQNTGLGRTRVQALPHSYEAAGERVFNPDSGEDLARIQIFGQDPGGAGFAGPPGSLALRTVSGLMLIVTFCFPAFRRASL
jgi:hypothetical protein